MSAPTRDLAHRTATDLAAAIRRREVSSRELLDHYLERVERLNPPLNAVVTLDAERARDAADAADRTLARGGATGPLHGVPMTIKDSHETAGLRTTSGFPPLAEHVPSTDAIAVGRLRAAGAVIFGKTNLPILAGDLQSFNPVFGTTSNPWDRSRTPGGSSGGAAAAIAAGLTSLELGSDIGGSIRTPAHWCGVYGHKPTHDIVPQRGHVPGPPGTLTEPDLAVTGPMGRSVEDLTLALDVLAGPLPEEAVAWSLTLPPPRHGALRDYRIAAWLADPSCPVDAPVRERLEASVAALGRAGARVDDRARPAIDFPALVRTYQQLLFPILTSDLTDEQFDALRATVASLAPDDDGPGARSARFGTLVYRDWLRAHEAREQMRASFAEFFREWDVLLCPVNPVAAIPHDHAEMIDRSIQVNGRAAHYFKLLDWIAPATMALLPATVAPVGRTADGLPVGLQIVGPYLEDRTPLAVAGHLAEVVGGFEPPPGY